MRVGREEEEGSDAMPRIQSLHLFVRSTATMELSQQGKTRHGA